MDEDDHSPPRLPAGLDLLNARRGDEVTVRTPRGPEALEVPRIHYPDG